MTLMGMAERLQPRTAAFRMELDDVGVEMTPGAATADVTLTASFIRRSIRPERNRATPASSRWAHEGRRDLAHRARDGD